MKIWYSNEMVLKGLMERDEKFITYVYRISFPQIRSLVLRHSGTQADVEDVFQDGLMVLYDQLLAGTLHLSCSVKTYLYSVCRYLWLRRLQRRNRLMYKDNCRVEELDAEYDCFTVLPDEVQQAKRRLYDKHLSQMSDDCRKLLMLYEQEKSYEEIAAIMHFKNKGIAKSRKYRCKETLRKKIKDDPEYQQLNEDE